MLTAYRRHSNGCGKAMGERKCTCPIWVNGRVEGELVRRALKTRNWDAAQRIVRDWEREGVQAATITMEEACDLFLDSLRVRDLRPASITKFEILTKELKWNFNGALANVTNTDLQELRKTWVMAPISRSKKLSRVKQFFRYCQEAGWIQQNPPAALKPPIFRKKQVVPFTPDQLEKILWATEIYPDIPKGRRAEVRAFVLLIRYTGLRIGDCVALRRENINDGKLFIRTEKTGTNVWLPVPSIVLEAIDEINHHGTFCFFSGNGTLKSAISSWHRSLSTLFRLAGVKGHPHQFRHTLACELLSKGVSMENVAAILGHQDIKITQAHYAAWVPARQAGLEAAISCLWK